MTGWIEYLAFGSRVGHAHVCKRTASAANAAQLTGWQVRTMRELRLAGYEILGYGEVLCHGVVGKDMS